MIEVYWELNALRKERERIWQLWAAVIEAAALRRWGAVLQAGAR